MRLLFYMTTLLSMMLQSCAVPPVKSGSVFDLWLFAGQSNDIGQGSKVDLPVELQEPQPTVPWVYKIYNSTGATVPSAATLWTELGPRGASFGPQVTFGADMTTLGHNVAISQFDISGSSLAVDWTDVRITEMLDYFDWAIASSVHNVQVKGFVWNQGEGDAESAHPERWSVYSANLSAFIAEVRARYGATLPAIITKLSVNNIESGTSTVRAQQVAYQASDAHGYLVDIDDQALKVDGVHWTSAGCMADGSRAAVIADDL